MWRVLFAAAASTGHFFLLGRTMDRFDEDRKDSSFIPRVIMLSSSLVFILAANAPSQPHRVQGRLVVPPYSLWLFTYFVQLLAVVFLIATQEPAFAILPIVLTAHTIAVSTQQSARCKLTPDIVDHAWPIMSATLLATATFLFFADAKPIDQLLDETVHQLQFRFDPSAKPIGYLDQQHSFFQSAIPVTVLVFVGSFALCHFSQVYRNVYMATDPDIPSILDPQGAGVEHIARFIAQKQSL